MFTPDSAAQRFLRTQPWHAGLPAALQQQVDAGVQMLEAAKGSVVLPAGEMVQGWYAVLSGLVMLQSPTDQGKRSAFIGVPDGEWFGEGSAIKSEVRRYHVIALRPTTLMCLPLPLFDALRSQSLGFNQYLVQHLNMRLGQAMTIIEAGRVGSPAYRVALYLSRLFWRSTRRLNLTQDELGQLVGLSRQTVNRVLRDLEAQGIVRVEVGRIAIVDDDALARTLQDAGKPAAAAAEHAPVAL
ncbi:Crp/Fnr family transcriptional regulator [Acidovorax lacteus]|uniref:Crp/Fnr family transcriptional regulator n=1 Tax=Acidovorax lacteus TaxID=1924988 RepID=A0ABP8L437_9BURK